MNRDEKVASVAELHDPSWFMTMVPQVDVLVVQASPLVEPVRLARTPEYAGCKSWVPLPVDGALADPVHDDVALQAIADRVRSSVG